MEYSNDALDELLHSHAPVVMRAMPVAVARCSADLRYLWVSQRYADWLDLSIQQIVGRPIVEVLGEEALTPIRPYIESFDGKHRRIRNTYRP